ncbi:hypothetical protein CHARACLAT_032399, partial [Characodon lateralis]|nr:hypothetical protein [Characodon lateralis]
QRDIHTLSPPIPMVTGVEEVGPNERGCFYAASGIMGSPLLPPIPKLCWKLLPGGAPLAGSLLL